MSQCIQHLLESTKTYPEKNRERREDTYRNGQHPGAAILCCSDSRVIPEEIFSSSIGDLFVIRTAGNTLGPNEEASFGYAFHHLGIRLFIVLGHTHCGAVSRTLKGEEGPIFAAIRNHIHDEKDPLKASDLNAQAVARELREKYPEAEVHALRYDIASGEVTVLSA